MNKRSFIKSLLLVAVAPTILIPKAKDAFVWKRNFRIVNPAWQDAPYEIENIRPFSYCEYAGTWRFTYQERNGIWVSEGHDGKPTPLFEPKQIYRAPYLEWTAPVSDVEIDCVFHRRKPC